MRAASSLPTARRADDEDAAVGRRHALNRLAQLIDRRRVSHQIGGRRRERLQLLHLALEARRLKRAFGDQHQAVDLERLFDEVVCPLLDRRHGGLDVAVAGNHHDRQVGVLLLEGIEQLQAIEPAALQPDVEKDQARPSCDDGPQGFVAIARRPGRVALVLEDAGDQLANIRFVIDDENLRPCSTHPRSLAPVRRPAPDGRP